MDILSQYKQQNPAGFEKKLAPATEEYGRAYTGMTAFVIRMSGGRIRDARGANYVLVGFTLLIGLVSLFLFFGTGSDSTSNLVPYKNPQNQQQSPELNNSYPTLVPRR